MSQGSFGGFQVRYSYILLLCPEITTTLLHYDTDTPHQCKPDNLFRERQGNNRRMDFRFSTLSTPMEGVEKSTRTERPCGSIALPLEEEEDE